ncbi:hypothetical protein AQPW35_46120 [Rubrivivax pictus]|uniref:Uncharacterized protein n=1 Tax=Pseudaquabacterium pictum TaxID=2315236 RepID=A0A480AVW1_9BURK|nr:hypothetical protein AQPW35_46120 [Rubrivivax pictus]
MNGQSSGRKNFSAWERGRMHHEAIRQGVYPARGPSRTACASTWRAHRARHSRSSCHPKWLPQLLSRLKLQERRAKPLADAIQQDQQGLPHWARSLAGSLAGRPSNRAAADVSANLIGEPPVQKAIELTRTPHDQSAQAGLVAGRGIRPPGPD